MCLFLAFPASAQHTTSSGGGGGSGSGGGSHSSGGSGGGSVSSGGGSHSTGGGGSSSVSHSSSGGPGIARSYSGGSRPAGGAGYRGVTATPQRPTYVYKQGALVRNTSQGIGIRTAVAVRGNYPERVGVASTVAYRSTPKTGYGRGYWGTHGYYHLNKGWYTVLYYNNIGRRCGSLPYGYYPFFWADMQYYYDDGLFYTFDNGEYTVVEPPVGAEVSSICDDAQSIVINGEQYYECTGVYYQKVIKDDGTVVYVVAGKDGVLNTDQQIQNDQPQGPQLGDIVTKLPADCRKIKVNGEVLYVSPDGVYYQEIIDANGNKTYKIVGLPADEATPDLGTD